MEKRLVACRINALDEATVSVEYRQFVPCAVGASGLGAQPQLQPLLDDAGQAGALLRRQRLRTGDKLVVEVERRLHACIIQNSVRLSPVGKLRGLHAANQLEAYIAGSASDGRTTLHGGRAMSQRPRKCIEQCFSWGKTIGMIRHAMVRGLAGVDRLFTLTMAAYKLKRVRRPATLRPQVA